MQGAAVESSRKAVKLRVVLSDVTLILFMGVRWDWQDWQQKEGLEVVPVFTWNKVGEGSHYEEKERKL